MYFAGYNYVLQPRHKLNCTLEYYGKLDLVLIFIGFRILTLKMTNRFHIICAKQTTVLNTLKTEPNPPSPSLLLGSKLFVAAFRTLYGNIVGFPSMLLIPASTHDQVYQHCIFMECNPYVTNASNTYS